MTNRKSRSILRVVEWLNYHCRDDTPERLFGDLAIRELDAVLTEAPLSQAMRVRAFSHKLGESPIGFFGASALAARYRRGFPRSLDGAPVLLPSADCPFRRDLDDWSTRPWSP